MNYKYSVAYLDNLGYPQIIFETNDKNKAIAETEWMNEHDSLRRLFGYHENKKE